MQLTKIILILFFYVISVFLLSQEKSIYFKFENNSKKTFLKEIESVNKVNELLYSKHPFKNDINFRIKDLLFFHNVPKMEIKILPKSEFKNIKLYSPDEVVDYVKKVQKEYPIWIAPPKGYPKMYVVVIENNCQKEYKAYEVHWQYYIE